MGCIRNLNGLGCITTNCSKQTFRSQYLHRPNTSYGHGRPRAIVMRLRSARLRESYCYDRQGRYPIQHAVSPERWPSYYTTKALSSADDRLTHIRCKASDLCIQKDRGDERKSVFEIASCRSERPALGDSGRLKPQRTVSHRTRDRKEFASVFDRVRQTKLLRLLRYSNPVGPPIAASSS